MRHESLGEWPSGSTGSMQRGGDHARGSRGSALGLRKPGRPAASMSEVYSSAPNNKSKEGGEGGRGCINRHVDPSLAPANRYFAPERSCLSNPNTHPHRDSLQNRFCFENKKGGGGRGCSSSSSSSSLS